MSISPRLTFDVVIAGGSHTGLAMALALATLGGSDVRIAVVERALLKMGAAPATTDPRSFAIGAASRNLLSVLGIWPRLAAEVQPVYAIDITDSSLENAIRPVLLSYDNRLPSNTRPDQGETVAMTATHIVPSDALSRALLDQVLEMPNISVLAPAAIVSYRASDSRVVLELGDGRSLRAALLIAADGARSQIRDAAGIKVRKSSPAQVAIVATVRHDRPHDGRAVQHFLPGGPFATLPLTGNRSCVTWSEDEVRGREIAALDDAAFLNELGQRFGYKLGALALDGPRALWPLELQSATALIGSRLALVGDAARTVHPIAGQGLNLAFRDVAALAECVVDGMRLGLDAADPMSLERYQQWRRFDSTMSSATFDSLNTLFSNDQLIVRIIRDAGLNLVDQLPGLKQMIVAEAAGLTGDVPKLLRGEAQAAFD